MMLKSEGLSAEQMDVQERDINMLKSLIKQERAVHKEEMERLNAKLRWYTQNQEMVDRDAAILEEQSKLIAKLCPAERQVVQWTKSLRRRTLSRRSTGTRAAPRTRNG